MSTIYLNLGSNLGDRRANIERAILMLASRYPRSRIRRAPEIQSDAWGFDTVNRFINVGIAIDLPEGQQVEPLALLDQIQAIEQIIAPGETHRNSLGDYIDRSIDIDIIAIDDLVYSHPRLKIPHPHAAARTFVMRPMHFLRPGWTPESTMTAGAPRKKTTAEMHRDTIEQFHSKEKLPLIVVLDNIRSLNNIGAIFRTCDAFAVRHVCLCGITATPPSVEIHKTALGAEDSVDWSYYDNTLEAISVLHSRGYAVCCLEQVHGSISLQDFAPTDGRGYAIVVGNEVDGVDPAVVAASDIYLEIPQFGTKHSLNVSVSAAIAMWHIVMRLTGNT